MYKYIGLMLLVLMLVDCSSIPSVQTGQTLEEYIEEIGFSGSILIARDGHVVHEKGYGFANLEQKIANNKDTQFLIGSITKQFTALAIMQLQERGLLNIDEYLSIYLPEFPHGSEIKIRNLLDHSSGLYNFTDEWKNIAYANLILEEVIDTFGNKPLTFTPGSKTRYTNSGYILAGKIIEVVSGQSYSEYIQENIYKPLGMVTSGYGINYDVEPNTATGYRKGEPLNLNNLTDTYAAGALSSSVSELFLWGKSFDSKPLVSEASLSEIFPSDRNGMGLGFGSGRFKVVMGLGWAFYETDYGDEYSKIGHIEGFSSIITRYPDKNSMIIILSNKDQYDTWALKNSIAQLIFSQ